MPLFGAPHCPIAFSSHKSLRKRIRGYVLTGLLLFVNTRPFRSTFETVLPVLKNDKVAAYDFGLVRGAMQCHYKWNKVDKDGNKIPYTEEPDPWFHDILQPDGTPYRPAEVEFIKSMTGRD